MMGIYKFENQKNGKCYIGQSVALEARYWSHFRNHQNSNLRDYNTKFYRALRKYGFECFTYSILEQADYFSKEELNKKEKYWIQYYDSYKNGYNSNLGGEKVTENAEKHPMAKLTNQEVLEIKKLLKNSNINQYDIAKQYNITQSEISNINEGKKWTTIGIYNYPIRKSGALRTGINNPKAIFTEEQVNEIRKRYVNESGRQIYQDYQSLCSYTTFERVLIGKTYTNLPIYKKKEKKWINN